MPSMHRVCRACTASAVHAPRLTAVSEGLHGLDYPIHVRGVQSLTIRIVCFHRCWCAGCEITERETKTDFDRHGDGICSTPCPDDSTSTGGGDMAIILYQSTTCRESLGNARLFFYWTLSRASRRQLASLPRHIHTWTGVTKQRRCTYFCVGVNSV